MLIALLAIGGLLCGAILALLAEVVPDNGGGGHTPTACPACNAPKGTAGLSPIRSAASACSKCGEAVSAGRLPVAVITGLVFALVGAEVGAKWQLVPLLFLSASVIALSAVDFARFRLPDKLVFPSLYIGIAMLGIFSFATGSVDHLVRGLIVMLAYSFVLLVPNLVMPAGLAFGDVKLGLLLGLFLGWVAETGIDAARLAVWAFLFGMILGVFTGLFVGIGRRIFGADFMPDPDFPAIQEDGSLLPLLKTQMPFGPALAASALALVVFSNQLLDGASILA